MTLSTARRRELKTAINDKLSAIDRLVGDENLVQVKDGNVHISAENFAEARELYREVGEAKALLDVAGVNEKMHANYDLNPDSDSIALATAGLGAPSEAKSVGEWFTDSEAWKDVSGVGSRSFHMSTGFEMKAFDISSGGMLQERKDVYGTMNPATYTRALGSIQFDPMVPRGYRRSRVRDLFPVTTTSSPVIDYFQVVGYASSNQGAKSVPDRNVGNTDFATKPHTNLVVRSKQAPVRTLAHWEAAHRNVLDDVPQLQSLINNELLYGLQLEEDRQIISGSGNDDELLGILNTPDTLSYTATSGELYSDSLRRALTKPLLANYESTGYVVHPTAWEITELQKGKIGSSGGDGQYMLFTNVSVGAEQRIWRTPVVETPAIPEGKFLTGAFGTGFQLYDRQLANIRTSEHHGDNFIKNSVTVLAECRLSLAGKRPESMCIGTFSVAGT